MNIKKTNMNKNVGFLYEVKEKLCDAKDSFIAHQTDLFLSVRAAKFSTKLILGAIVLVVFFVGTASSVHSIHSNEEKSRYIEELDRKIKAQEETNKQVEDELKGNLDAYIEEKARTEHEMVYPDEEIYINMAG